MSRYTVVKLMQTRQETLVDREKRYMSVAACSSAALLLHLARNGRKERHYIDCPQLSDKGISRRSHRARRNVDICHDRLSAQRSWDRGFCYRTCLRCGTAYTRCSDWSIFRFIGHSDWSGPPERIISVEGADTEESLRMRPGEAVIACCTCLLPAKMISTLSGAAWSEDDRWQALYVLIWPEACGPDASCRLIWCMGYCMRRKCIRDKRRGQLRDDIHSNLRGPLWSVLCISFSLLPLWLYALSCLLGCWWLLGQFARATSRLVDTKAHLLDLGRPAQ